MGFLFLIYIHPITSIAQTYADEVRHIGEGIRLEIGAYVPYKNLSRAFQISPVLTLAGGVYLNDKFRLDPQFSFVFVQSEDKVPLIEDPDVLDGRVSSIITIGASLNRVFSLNRISAIDVRAGTGFSYLLTDRKTYDAPKNEDDEYFDAATMYFTVGVGYKIAAFKFSYIGLELNYHFTPYNLFHQHFYSSFGTQTFSIGLSYGL